MGGREDEGRERLEGNREKIIWYTMSHMKQDTVMIRVSRELRKKLKVKAAEEEITIAELLDKELGDV